MELSYGRCQSLAVSGSQNPSSCYQTTAADVSRWDFSCWIAPVHRDLPRMQPFLRVFPPNDPRWPLRQHRHARDHLCVETKGSRGSDKIRRRLLTARANQRTCSSLTVHFNAQREINVKDYQQSSENAMNCHLFHVIVPSSRNRDRMVRYSGIPRSRKNNITLEEEPESFFLYLAQRTSFIFTVDTSYGVHR